MVKGVRGVRGLRKRKRARGDVDGGGLTAALVFDGRWDSDACGGFFVRVSWGGRLLGGA